MRPSFKLFFLPSPPRVPPIANPTDFILAPAFFLSLAVHAYYTIICLIELARHNEYDQVCVCVFFSWCIYNQSTEKKCIWTKILFFCRINSRKCQHVLKVLPRIRQNFLVSCHVCRVMTKSSSCLAFLLEHLRSVTWYWWRLTKTLSMSKAPVVWFLCGFVNVACFS